MNNKEELLNIFNKNPDRYWKVRFFDEVGFKRQKCKKCGKYFWSIIEQDYCNDSSCRTFEFIENPVVKKKLDYIEAQEVIQNFFIANNHEPVAPYPVLCRWFPGLFFNIASIVSFQRASPSGTVFEFPKNPLIIFQPCLRFNDIPNVGITGKHLTIFTMIGQHSNFIEGKEGYWKDRCIELDYKLWTEIIGIPKEKINFIEDVWVGPSAFGSCLETHVSGNEIGNSVFTEFEGSINNFKQMNQKVVDVGLGLDRIVWLSQATPTIYDAIFHYVLEKMIKKYSIEYDRMLMKKYSKISGLLNFDEVVNIEKAKEEIAKAIGVDKIELERKIEPIQQAYAICDHTKTILFAIKDGGIPSNVGGGYNLRAVLRRAFDFSNKLGIEIEWVIDKHIDYFKNIYPEIYEIKNKVNDIIIIEKKKWLENKRRTSSIISNFIGKEIREEKLIELYDSHGITPEILIEASKGYDIKFKIPSDFYAKITSRHMQEEVKEIESKFNLNGIPETIKLFHIDEKIIEFDAKVLKIIDGKHVILDKTAFYPESGGQVCDFGKINGKRVYNVQKIGEWIIHDVENIDFKENDIVKCEIDKKRREQLKIHHTATHILNTAARNILGEHVWQSGTKKDEDKAHLDITHYNVLSEEEIKKIENLANKIIKSKIKIRKEILKRVEAELKYGFRIYQGGPIPLNELRIVSINELDHEACGGTHLDNTEDVELIIIIKTEKPQDGIVRLFFVAGPAAKNYLRKCENIVNTLKNEFGTDNIEVEISKLVEKWKRKRKELEYLRKQFAEKSSINEFKNKNNLKYLIKNCGNVSINELREISKKLSSDNTVIFLYGSLDNIIFASAGNHAIKQGINIGAIIKEINEKFGTSGGGSENLGQLKVKNNVDDILKYLNERFNL